MQVTVRLFAAEARAVGAPTVDIDVPEPHTAESAIAALQARWPALAASRGRLAVNLAFAEPGLPITPQDELAWIGPVSGG